MYAKNTNVPVANYDLQLDIVIVQNNFNPILKIGFQVIERFLTSTAVFPI